MRKHCLRTTFEAHTFLTLGQGWQMASERRTAVRLYDGTLHVQDVLLAGQLRGDELFCSTSACAAVPTRPDVGHECLKRVTTAPVAAFCTGRITAQNA